MPFGLGKKKPAAAAEGTDTTATAPAADRASLSSSSHDNSSVSTHHRGQEQQEQHNVATKTVSRASTTHEYPQGLRLALLLISVFISMFLVALDRLIISTVRFSLPLSSPAFQYDVITNKRTLYRPSPASRMNSNPSRTSAGTARRTC